MSVNTRCTYPFSLCCSGFLQLENGFSALACFPNAEIACLSQSLNFYSFLCFSEIAILLFVACLENPGLNRQSLPFLTIMSYGIAISTWSQNLLFFENVIACFSDAVIEHWLKATWEKGLVSFYTFMWVVHHGRKSRQVEEPGTETLKNFVCLFASPGLLTYIFHTYQITWPKDGIVHCGLGTTVSIDKEENTP